MVSGPITEDIWNKALTVDNGVSIAGTISYEDEIGNRNDLTFCIGRLATGAIAFRETSENCHNAMR